MTDRASNIASDPESLTPAQARIMEAQERRRAANDRTWLASQIEALPPTRSAAIGSGQLRPRAAREDGLTPTRSPATLRLDARARRSLALDHYVGEQSTAALLRLRARYKI